MRRENLEGEWMSISDKLRSRFPKLTAADVIYEKGYEDDLLERIGIKIKKSRAEVLTLIATL
jgi:hypothetical protein